MSATLNTRRDGSVTLIRARRLLLAGLLGLVSGLAAAADELVLARVQERLSLAAAPWCGRAAELDNDGIRRCRLRVRVLEDNARPAANAVQLAATIGVTRSLLQAVDEHELAFVLGHEVAHLALGHGQLLLRQRAKEAVAASVAQAEALRALDHVLSASGPAFHPDTPVDRKQQEFDADALGLVFAVRAGYDAEGAMRMFRRWVEALPEWEQSLGDSHPPPAERVRAVSSVADVLCRGWRRSRPLLPAQERLLPQESYRRAEAATAALPSTRCDYLEMP